MDAIFQKIQQAYDYSDYEIKVLKYMIIGTLSDVSKMLVLFYLFYKIDRLLPFVVSLITFMLLRQLAGGLHCKTYLGCFLVSLVYFLSTVVLIPHFFATTTAARLARCLLLLLSMFLEYRLGPILSNRELHISQRVTRIKKGGALLLILLYLLFDSIQPSEPYHLYGIYTIYLHAVQLVYTKILKEVKNHETSVKSYGSGIL